MRVFHGPCIIWANCQVGHKNIFANGALLGGHVVMKMKRFYRGAAQYQFVRIGRLAMMRGTGLEQGPATFMMSTAST